MDSSIHKIFVALELEIWTDTQTHTWGASLGEGKSGVKVGILNEKVSRWARIRQTFPLRPISGDAKGGDGPQAGCQERYRRPLESVGEKGSERLPTVMNAVEVVGPGREEGGRVAGLAHGKGAGPPPPPPPRG